MILYFIPTGSQATPPEWATTRRDCTSGPGGLAGAIYSDGSGRTGYYPDMQTWSESGGLWLGVDREPVTPVQLERAEMIGGHYVRLEGGQDWLIPVARCFPAGSRLPQALILGPGGELVAEVLPRFAAVCAGAERAWAALTGGEEMTLADAWALAVSALAINYRIGAAEASALRLLTTANVPEVLKAFVDYPTVLAAAKKKPNGGDSGTAGGAA